MSSPGRPALLPPRPEARVGDSRRRDVLVWPGTDAHADAHPVSSAGVEQVLWPWGPAAGGGAVHSLGPCGVPSAAPWFVPQIGLPSAFHEWHTLCLKGSGTALGQLGKTWESDHSGTPRGGRRGGRVPCPVVWRTGCALPFSYLTSPPRPPPAGLGCLTPAETQGHLGLCDPTALLLLGLRSQRIREWRCWTTAGRWCRSPETWRVAVGAGY